MAACGGGAKLRRGKSRCGGAAPFAQPKSVTEFPRRETGEIETRGLMPRRRAPPDDLYAVLGVSPDASAADIKRAYRRLAVKHRKPRHSPPAAALRGRV